MPTAGFEIRRANYRDAAAIAGVHVQAWREAYTGVVPDSVLDQLDVADRTRRWQQIFADNAVRTAAFVARTSDQIVGFAHCGPLRSPEEGEGGEITAIYILRAAQRRGIGRALMAESADALRSFGITDLTAWVLAENWPARRFYEALGGVLRAEKTITRGRPMQEVAYFWEDAGGLTIY